MKIEIHHEGIVKKTRPIFQRAEPGWQEICALTRPRSGKWGQSPLGTVPIFPPCPLGLRDAFSRYLHGVFSLFVIIFVCTQPLCAAPAENHILNFANWLYHEEDYYRAITEYKRFLFLYPTHPQKNQIEFQIGQSYLKGQKWEAALAYFQKLAIQFPEKRIGQDAQFLLAQTLFFSKQYDFSIREWKTFQTQFPKHPLLEASYYQTAWAYFLQEKIEQAQQELTKIGEKATQKRFSAPGETSDLRMTALSLSQEIDKWDQLPYRSPFLAGTFSAMLPGLGQWYVGRFWDGTAALVVNGMFAYGIYRTWVNEFYVSFGILTFLASGFYGGNIYSAVNSAQKYNKNVKETEWTRLQKQYGLSFSWTQTQLKVSF